MYKACKYEFYMYIVTHTIMFSISAPMFVNSEMRNLQNPDMFEALIIHCPSKHHVGMCGF